MGTGIVFVVLVAIWGAYFVQYWSRRREHLATARSVEAFSEAMRVLERRPAPRVSISDRISTAYAVSPARVISRPAPRPQVIAKPRPAPTPSGGDTDMRLPDALAPALRRTHPRRRPTGASRSASTRPSPVAPSRKVRGLVLLAALVTTVALVGLAAFSVVRWWAPLAGVAAVLGAFVWVRSAVQAEIRARRSARATVRRSRPGSRPAASGSTRVTAPRSAPVDLSAAPRAEEHEVADLAVNRELVEESTVTAESSEAATADAQGADGWSPVPVPPPTYTLKARAEAPGPAALDDDDIASPVSAAEEECAPEARAAYGT